MREEFNKCYADSIESGKISNDISNILMKLIDMKIKDSTFGSYASIVKSDILMDALEFINLVINKDMIIEKPYSYFNILISNDINTIYRKRFSDIRTQDEYGCSIIIGKNSDQTTKVAKFIDFKTKNHENT